MPFVTFMVLKGVSLIGRGILSIVEISDSTSRHYSFIVMKSSQDASHDNDKINDTQRSS